MEAHNYQPEEVVTPRHFLQQIIMQESLSTIRVLAFFIVKAQTGQPEIEASYTELSQATGLCRQSVQEGINRAIEQGYLSLVQAGSFFSPARYALVGVSGLGGQVSGEETGYQTEADYSYQPKEDEGWSTNPTCTTFHTTSSLDSNIESINRIGDRIELESEEAVYISDQSQKVDHSPTYPPAYPQTYPQGVGNTSTYPPEVVHISAYLTNMGNDFSIELGDPTHTRSNRTQIHNLWHKSALPEKDFAQVMYEARKLTKQFAIIRPGEKAPPLGQIRNRMAYFFTVLRDLLGLSTNRSSHQTGRNGKSTDGARPAEASHKSGLSDQTRRKANYAY